MTRKKHHDGDDGGGGDRPREVAAAEKSGEKAWQAALRPRTFDEYIGQRELIDNLKVSVRAAKQNGWTLDHFLFAGPPGLGKTTLAHVIANELGVNLHVSSGPAIDHKGMLASLLTSLGEGDALFIDEIHRLAPVVEENLYPAMEDFRFDLFIGDGPHAKAVTMQLPRFTLLGATTRMGLLSAPLLDRFGFHWQLRYYELPDMVAIVRRSAQLIGVRIDGDGATEIARRARGTPRIANRLLRRVRDFAAVERDGAIDGDIAASSLDRLAVDHAGLDALDRGYLSVICERFDGGPVGIEAVAASLSEERGTLEEVVEPFLLQVGFIARTPRGRVATAAGFQHMGLVARARRRAAARAAPRAGCFRPRPAPRTKVAGRAGSREARGRVARSDPGGARRARGRAELRAGWRRTGAAGARGDPGGLERRGARLHRAGGVRRVPSRAARAVAGEPARGDEPARRGRRGDRGLRRAASVRKRRGAVRARRRRAGDGVRARRPRGALPRDADDRQARPAGVRRRRGRRPGP